MILTYKNKKLQDLCENSNSNRELVKKYGVEVAKKLPLRIMYLKQFESVNDIPVSKPFKRHKLEGNRKNEFAINITDKYRLIFIPDGNTIIVEDLKEIREIKIMEVSKHYE